MYQLAPALLLLFLAAALRPPEPSPTPEALAWTAPMFRAALLGRQLAAADVAWLALVQTLGSRVAERAGFPTVTSQVDIVTTLDPALDLAYHFGAIIVLTDPEQAQRLAPILARAQAAFPNDPQFPQMKGFLEHFGRLDFLAAALHYRESLALGGPAYLGPLADRLSTAALQCRQVRDDFAASVRTAGAEEGVLLLAKAAQVLHHCEETRLEAAVAQFNMNQGRIPTLQELVDGGLEKPMQPPGQCWQVTRQGAVQLGACP